MAKVEAVCISKKKGEKKIPVDMVQCLVNYGIEGDAHAGSWHRQMSLLGVESVNRLKKLFPELHPGDFAENILTEGITLYELPVGTLLQVGEVLLEVSQIGKECHNHCNIRQQVGDCVMPREGIFAIVKKEGSIFPGDEIEVIS